MSEVVALCAAADLVEGGHAVAFDVVLGGEPCRAFAIRFEGRPHAYVNRCSHVAMEMDYQPDRFFDDSGQWLLCATHGAVYKPDTGECAGGPCQGGLVKGGHAVAFDVVLGGEPCRAFAIRFEGRPHAYVNRCSHVAMEMDYQPDRFFDDSGQWLLCATHGAVYKPDTGECAGGPCQGGLVKVELSERDGTVHWHTAPHLQPLVFET